MTVTPVNDPPVAVADSVGLNEDAAATSIAVLANDTDVDGDPKTITSATQGTNGAVLVTGGGTGLTYRPNADFFGTDTFTYTLNGGSTATVTVTVNPVDDAPVAVSDSASLTEDSGATPIAVLANDTDIDAGPQAITAVTQGANGSVLVTGGGTGLTYQPNANFVGADSFTYTLNGGSSATVNVTVTPVNDAPVAGDDSYTVAEDGSLTVVVTGLLANDVDVDGDAITATIVTQPAHGILTANPDGSFTYNPSANFVGTDTFTYRAGDGSLSSNLATVTLTVTPVNDAPTATGLTQLLTVAEDSAPTALFATPPTLADIDSGTLTAILTLADGTAGALTGAGAGTMSGGTTAYTITGTTAEVTAALAAVQFDSAANFNGTTSVSVSISDGANGPQGTNPSGTISVTVTPVNDAPTVTAGSTLTYAENGAAAPIDDTVTIADVDSPNLTGASVAITGNDVSGQDLLALPTTPGISGTFDPATGVLTLTGTASIAVYQSALRSVTYANTSDDPSAAARTISFAVTDGTDASVPATSTVTVTPVNDAPTLAATPGNPAFSENGPAVDLFSGVNLSTVEAGQTVNDIVLQVTNVVNGAAERLIVGGTPVALVAGSTTTSDGITVTVALSGTTATATLSNLAGIAPASAQTLIDGIAYQNTSDDPGSLGRAVTIVSLDDSGGTANGGVDTVAPGITSTVAVTPLNDAPTATGLTQSLAISEDGPTVNLFTTAPTLSDVDSANVTATLTLADAAFGVLTGAGSGVASGGGGTVYTITGTLVAVNTALAAVQFDPAADATGASSVSVTIDDGANGPQGGNPTGSVSISIGAINDAPAATNLTQSLTFAEDASPLALFTAPPVVTDVDNSSVTATLTLADTASGVLAGGGFAAGTTAGSYTVTGTAAQVGAALAAVQFDSADNFVGATSVSVLVDDGADGPQGSNPTGSVTITVTLVNDAPTVAAGATLGFTEGQGATAIDTSVTVADLDNATLAGATVQITGNYAPGEDVLGFANTTTITGSFDPATGTLTLSGSDTVANYQAALRSVTFANSSEAPSTLARTVSFVVNDGTAASVAATSSVTVASVNDAPTQTGTGATVTFTENGPPADLFSGVGASTVEPGQSLDQLVLTVSNVSGTGGDSLVVDGTTLVLTSGNSQTTATNLTTAAVALSGSTATVTISKAGGVTAAAMAALIDGLAYANASENPDGVTHTITLVSLRDTGGVANAGQDTATPLNIAASIAVTPVNDAPVVTAGGTLAYTENQPATAIAPALTVFDVDTPNLTSATVQITAGYASGQDFLAFTDQNGIVGGAFDAATGVLSLSGNSSRSNYEAALRSVTYVNTSDNPTAGSRTVSFTVNDGAAASAAATRTITVTAVDDAPVAVADSITVNEDSGATQIDVLANDTDVDGGPISITAVTQPTNGTVAITGGGTGLTYRPNANYNNTAGTPDTFTYTLTPGGSATTVSVVVNAVNDAPVVAVPAAQVFAEDTTRTFSALNGNAISVSDVDAGASPVEIVLSASLGTISLDGTTGLTFLSGDGVSDSSLVARGAISDINAALDGLVFTPTPNANGTGQITVLVGDLAATGSGGSANDSDAVTLNITAVNDAPVNNGVPASIQVQSGFAQAITGLSISDVDAGTAMDVTTTLASAGGTIAVGAAGGVAISGSGTGSVTLTGSISAINTALAGNNVLFTAPDGATAPTTTTLTITTNDAGNSGADPGAGGTGTLAHELDTDTILVDVLPQVWFINGNQTGIDSGAPRGSQTNPFETVAQYNAAAAAAGGPGPNDYIYVKAGTYTGDGINLKDGQTLLGDGEALSFPNPRGGAPIVVDEGGGARPVINVTTAGDQGIDLASGNTVRGIDITTGSGTTGLDDGTNVVGGTGGNVGNLAVTNMAISGAGQAIDIDQGGTVNATFSSIASSGAGQGIELVNLDNSTFTVTGATNIADATADGIAISNSQGSTFTFGGLVTILNDVGAGTVADGVDLQFNNLTDSTFNFNGGVDITVNGSNAFGFRAQSSGIVNIADPAATPTQITSVNGTALLINPTQLNATIDSITSSGGTNGIDLTGMTGSLTVGTVTINGQTGDGVAITNSAGSVTIGGGSIGNSNDPGSNGVDIEGGAGNVTINAAVNKTSAGNLVEVTNRAGGTVDFNGLLTSNAANGGGIGLDNNDVGGGNHLIRFDGGVQLSTGTAPAFTATNGGTVAITGGSNTLVASTGTALNVANTNIHSDGLTFRSISANGGTNGIVLTNTSTNGFLTVTGDGSQTGGLYDRDGSGGTIQNTTGDAVSLTNAFNVTLRKMNITNAGFDGVQSIGGGNIVLSAVDINTPGQDNPAAGSTGNPTGFGAGNGWYAENITGTNAFDNNSRVFNWQSLQSNGVVINNTNTDFTSFTVDNALFSTSATGAAGFHANLNGTTDGRVDITDSELTLIDQNAAQILNNGSGAIRAIVQNNYFHDADATGGDGNNTLFLALAGSGDLNFTISNNEFINLARLISTAGVVQVNAAGGSGTSAAGAQLNGTISSNIVENPGFVSGRRGIVVLAEASAGDHGGHTVAIQNNSVQGLNGIGIYASLTSVGGFDLLNNNVTIRNNSVGTSAAVGQNGGDGGSAIEFETGIDADNTGGQISANVLIQSNVAVSNNSSGVGDTLEINNRSGVSTGAGNSSQLNLTILGNNLSQLNNAGQVFDISNSSMTTTTIRLDLNSDNATASRNTVSGGNGTDIQLRNPSGVFLVENLGAATAEGFLETRNTGQVTIIGTIGATGAVPLPSNPSFLIAAAGGVTSPSGGGGITDPTAAQLDPVVAAAFARWAEAGLTADQLDALRSITVSVADLGADRLAAIQDSGIVIDDDAAGHGWFIDPTPLGDSEFATALSATRLRTDPSGAPAGDMDLLTTLMHEMGHALGLDDLYGGAQADELMYGALVTGERRLPDAVVPGTAGNDTFLVEAAGAILAGGAGADGFVFDPAFLSAVSGPLTRIADYSALQGDTVDLSPMLSAHGGPGGHASLIRVQEDTGGTFATLQVATEGGAKWTSIAQLDGIHIGDTVRVVVDPVQPAQELHAGWFV